MFVLRKGIYLNFQRFVLIIDAKAYKKFKTMICHVRKYCKDRTAVYLLFTATCSCMNSPVNETNRLFHGFLSDSAEITSCAYTKTIIHLRLS